MESVNFRFGLNNSIVKFSSLEHRDVIGLMKIKLKIDKENKCATIVAPKVMHIPTDINRINNNNYINIFKKDVNRTDSTKNQRAEMIRLSKDVGLMINQVLTDISNFNDNIYLNVSVINDNAGFAPVGLMVNHQIDTLDLHRYSGSIPGWGDPASNLPLIKNQQRGEK